MNKKIKIEDIEQMLPDYISGNLDEKDRERVEKALSDFPELNGKYLEYKRTFDFVSSVKFEEPMPQYWAALLPRIHERIEKREQSRSWLPIKHIWKVLLPAAAVLLLFIIYKIVTSPGPEITKEQKTKETIISDTVRKQAPKEIREKEPEIRNTEKSITEMKKEKSVKQPKRTIDKYKEHILPEEQKTENEYAVEKQENGKDEELASNEMFYNITSSVDDVEAIYEESEKEYNNLSNSEKTEVLNKLKDINL